VSQISEWYPQAVRIGKVGKHPNADNLSITHVLGNYPVIFRSDEFSSGELVGYIPPDTVVPRTTEFDFLFKEEEATTERVKAVKLRGLVSHGFFIRLPNKDGEEMFKEGEDIVRVYDLKKYEPPERRSNFLSLGSPAKRPDTPIEVPVYDIEGLRRYPDIIDEDEEVIITEKIHGTNARFLYWNGKFYVGSRNNWVDPEGNSVWAEVARRYEVEKALKRVPRGSVLYGEIYGKGIQSMSYGLDTKELVVFDVYHFNDTKGWYWYPIAVEWLARLSDLPYVPILYRGRFDLETCYNLSNGPSTVPGADHVREGIVVRPVISRYDYEIQGNLVLKLAGEDYLINKRS